MSETMKRAIALSLLLACPTLAFARVQNEPKTPAAPAAKGFRADFLANLNDVQEKLVSLAEATPAEKFAWRPDGDIRSISEVYMHIAGGNYFLSTFIGVKAPANLDRDMEKNVRSKEAVVAELRKSFEHLRGAVKGLSDAEFDKAVKMFGNTTTYRGVLVTMLSHLHEHLGQSIAYARMNKVVPPWSH
jgi:hypothetical protein